MMPFVQKPDHFRPIVVVGRVLRQRQAIAGLRQVDVEDLTDGGRRTVTHHDDPIGQQHRLVHVMGDHDHRVVEPGLDLHQGVLHMGAGQGVQRAEGFVHQQHLGLHGQGPGDADPLFHAVGDLIGLAIQGMGHVHQIQIMQGPFVPLPPGLGLFEDLIHRQTYIVVDGQPGQQRVVLEHHRSIRTGLGHFLLLQDYPALGRLQQARDDVQHGRLAATGVADQGDELALLDLQVHIVQYV